MGLNKSDIDAEISRQQTRLQKEMIEPNYSTTEYPSAYICLRDSVMAPVYINMHRNIMKYKDERGACHDVPESTTTFWIHRASRHLQEVTI